jgi:3-oxoacyl-[acyl-carrier protein] reductase
MEIPSTCYPELREKIVLVTGSSKALGAETARAFARQGARVVVHGRDQSSIDHVVESIRAFGGDCIGVAADILEGGALSRLRATIEERFGEVDILACFAGGLGQPRPLLDMSEELWRSTIEGDLTSKFLTTRTFAPAMRDRNAGVIILMSSAAGRQLSEASGAYAAAHAGTLMLMRHLAVELGPAGVRVNALAPAATRNEKMRQAMSRETEERIASSLPLRRIGEPSDIANAALFLASNAASWITGQVLDVNGGKVMV